MAPKTQPAPTKPPAASAPQGLVLPVLIASPVDVGRLIRELEVIDQSLLQLELRSGGSAVKMPQTSHLMDQLIELNKINLLQKDQRAGLQQFLTDIRTKAPKLHMSFSADPTTAFIEKLMVWLRREIHPYILLTVGLQPTIGAGCIVRSTNKYFDLSLRKDFAKKRELLFNQVAGIAAPPAAATKLPAPAEGKA